MTLFRPLRSFTTRIFNPIFRRVAAWVPGFAILEYVGRKSGRRYRIPVKVFRHGPDHVISLMYGRDVEWVKNILAAGEAELRVRRRTTHLTDPKVVVDPSRALLPWYHRPLWRLLRVNEFMTMDEGST